MNASEKFLSFISVCVCVFLLSCCSLCRHRHQAIAIDQSLQIQSLLLVPTKLNLLALLNIQWRPTDQPSDRPSQPASQLHSTMKKGWKKGERKNVFISIQVTQLVGEFWTMMEIRPIVVAIKKHYERSTKIIQKSIVDFHKWNYAAFFFPSSSFSRSLCAIFFWLESGKKPYNVMWIWLSPAMALAFCIKMLEIKICSLFSCFDIVQGTAQWKNMHVFLFRIRCAYIYLFQFLFSPL